MSRRTRIATAIGAVLLLGLGALPMASAADRVLPHAITLWDTDQCAGSTGTDHAVFGMAGPLLRPGHAGVQVVQARPLGLPAGARWRTWVVPVSATSEWTGAVDTAAPPHGWSRRTAAAGTTVRTGSRAELDLEIWPGPGRSRTSLRGFLVTYRTTLGIIRTVRTPTQITTRRGGCV